MHRGRREWQRQKPLIGDVVNSLLGRRSLEVWTCVFGILWNFQPVVGVVILTRMQQRVATFVRARDPAFRSIKTYVLNLQQVLGAVMKFGNHQYAVTGRNCSVCISRACRFVGSARRISDGRLE